MAVTPSGGQTRPGGVAPGLAVYPRSNHNGLAYQSSGPGTGGGPVRSAGLMIACLAAALAGLARCAQQFAGGFRLSGGRGCGSPTARAEWW